MGATDIFEAVPLVFCLDSCVESTFFLSVQAILSKIGAEAEIEQFNGRLQQLLLGSKGLLAGWLDAQKLLQEVGAIAARARSRCEDRAKAAGVSHEETQEASIESGDFVV